MKTPMPQGDAGAEMAHLRQRLRAWRQQLALATAQRDWLQLRQLNADLQQGLLALGAKPGWRAAVQAELDQLAREHRQALACCRDHRDDCARRLHEQAGRREGLQAYGEVAACP